MCTVKPTPVRVAPLSFTAQDRPFDPDREVALFRSYVRQMDTRARQDQARTASENDRLWSRNEGRTR